MGGLGLAQSLKSRSLSVVVNIENKGLGLEKLLKSFGGISYAVNLNWVKGVDWL